MRVLLIILSMFALSVPTYAYDKFKICLTGTTEKTIPHYGDAFYQGALLAYEELSLKKQSKIAVVTNYYGPTPLASLHKTKELLENKCSVILGFSTGNDLLGVHRQTKKNPILVLSIYGDPLTEFKDNPSIMTLQPGPESLLLPTLEKLNVPSGSKALVVTAIDRKEMMTYKNFFQRQGTKFFKKIDYENVLESDQKIDQVISKLRKNKYDHLILFTRSSIAARISDSLPGKENVKIIGTKYFGSPELPAFLNFLTDKKVKAYFSRQNLMDKEDKEIVHFIDRYKKRFLTSPMVISLESYNLMKFLEKVFDETEDFSPENVLRVVHSSKEQFIGIGGVEAIPLKNLRHKGLHSMEITESGYKVMK